MSIASLALIGLSPPMVMTVLQATGEDKAAFQVLPIMFQCLVFVITVLLPGVYFARNKHMTNMVARELKEEVMYRVIQ